MSKKHLLLFVCLGLMTNFVYAEKAELQKLEKRCNDAREKKIAPLRQNAIKECIAKDNNMNKAKKKEAKERCERHYIDYGAAVRYKNVGGKERMFNDLPECLKFYEAEKKYKAKSKR